MLTLFDNHCSQSTQQSLPQKQRFAILSQATSLSNTFLVEYLKKKSIDADVFYLDKTTQLNLEKQCFVTGEGEFPFSNYFAFYGRTWGDLEARSQLHHYIPTLEKYGLRSLESLDSVLMNHNKQEMMQVFLDNDIPMPLTLMPKVGTRVEDMVQQVLSTFSGKVVIKREGSGGKNIEFIDLNDQGEGLRAALELQYPQGELTESLVLQQYIENKDDNDYSYHYRVLAVKGEVCFTMKFTASDTDMLASNISSGGKAVLVDEDIFSPMQKALIKKACLATGVNVAGVDLIIPKHQNDVVYFFEVNNSPGLATAVTQCQKDTHLIAIAELCHELRENQCYQYDERQSLGRQPLKI